MEVPHTYNHIFQKQIQENFDPTGTTFFLVLAIKETTDPYSMTVEIILGKMLNIILELHSNQEEQLICILQKHSGAFS